MSYKYQYINTIGNMSIRPAPNVNNTPVGSLSVNVTGYGNELQVYPNGDKWLKIEKGGSAIGWVAVIHQSKPYGTLTEVVSNPDPEPTPTPEVIYPDALEITPLDKNNQPIAPKKIYKVL